MTFPNLTVATLGVARITQRDSGQVNGEGTYQEILWRLVVDLSPLVMAMWSE
jgi:hypothetical protein